MNRKAQAGRTEARMLEGQKISKLLPAGARQTEKQRRVGQEREFWRPDKRNPEFGFRCQDEKLEAPTRQS